MKESQKAYNKKSTKIIFKFIYKSMLALGAIVFVSVSSTAFTLLLKEYIITIK